MADVKRPIPPSGEFDDSEEEYAFATFFTFLRFDCVADLSSLHRDSAPKSTIRAAPRRRRRGYADGTPDQQMLTAWGKGDDDLEPSAKMLALIEELRVAEREGDKTIVYSQCEFLIRFWSQISSANNSFLL